MYPLAFSDINLVDDYGNMCSIKSSSQLDTFLISTNTYGGYDYNHFDLMDAEI